MTHKLYDLAVKTGTYIKDGQEKGRYQNIGAVMQANDGGKFILLDPLINLAAVPRAEGKDRVMVSMFKDDGNKQAPAPAASTPHQQAKANGYAPQAGADNDIPF